MDIKSFEMDFMPEHNNINNVHTHTHTSTSLHITIHENNETVNLFEKV